jgi:thiamine biosynthesis lipoprotein
MLGTYVEIAAEEVPSCERMLERAFTEIEQVERLLNRHDSASELSRLNQAGGQFISMSALSVRVLALARKIMRLSEGRFNCANKPCTADDIEIRVSLVRIPSGLALTLDGIAKGVAVDLAVHSLQKAGAPGGWVNAGGDLRAFGTAEIPLWRRELDGQKRLVSRIRQAAVATSQGPHNDPSLPGRIEGFHGFEAHPGIFSVLAPTASLADALTKVACVTPENQRARVIEQLGGWLVPEQAS